MHRSDYGEDACLTPPVRSSPGLMKREKERKKLKKECLNLRQQLSKACSTVQDRTVHPRRPRLSAPIETAPFPRPPVQYNTVQFVALFVAHVLPRRSKSFPRMPCIQAEEAAVEEGKARSATAQSDISACLSFFHTIVSISKNGEHINQPLVLGFQ